MSFPCGPCLEGGKKLSAVQWCVNCEEHLCSGCVQHHQSLKLTKNHKLTGISLPSVDHGHNLTNRCVHHPSKEQTLFCSKHDTLLCVICLDMFHNSCQRDVMAIEIAAQSKDQVNELNKYKIEIGNIIQSFSNIVENKEKIESAFINETANAKQKISELKSRLTKYLEQMEEVTFQTLSRMEMEVLGKLLIEKSDARGCQREAENLHSDILSVGSDKEAFILSQRIKSFKAEKEQKLKELSYNMQAYSLKVDLLDPALLEDTFSMKFAQVNIETIRYEVKLTQEMKISVSCFEPCTPINHDMTITCMSVTDEGNLVLGELNIVSTSKIYLFSAAGVKMCHLPLAKTAIPQDIAAIPGCKNEVAVLDSDSNISFLEFFGHKDKSLKMAKGCNFIDASHNKLYAGYPNQIIVMDIQGQYLETIKLSEGPIQCLHAEQNGDVYYSTADTIYCRKEFGEVVCLYKSRDLQKVTSIDVDLAENVYISGKKSNNIHVLKQKNSLAEVVLKKENGINHPKRICLHKPSNRLYVLRSEYKPIQVYSFK